jgi:hypothetical protein
MVLSWNEIKARAAAFVQEWKDETSEDAEAKSFWDGFFQVFGVSRRRVASFEQAVRKASGKPGFIDLFWKGVLLVEHKSRGKDLDRAFDQALDYFPGLSDKELPRYVLVSDFARFRLYDLEEGTQADFPLADLVQHVHRFGFVAGYEKRTYKEEDPVNVEAAELMGRLHDRLHAVGYTGHDLEVYLVRLLFCLFADDTGIFEKGSFRDYLENRTAEDGSDLAPRLAQVFEVLNKPPEKRLRNLDEDLAALPYVNGRLFDERLGMAGFDREMRELLLECGRLDWGRISPAIFGSLFQSVMQAEARRNLGAHYTSEKNILKLIGPLFLDDLKREFVQVRNDRRRLAAFHQKLAGLRFLDPACGCGNFLIIAYRELRLLEIEVIRALQQGQQVLSVNDLVLVDVDQFFGIEIEEFPAQIAQVALWLMDHQMNQQVAAAFGEYFVRLPLTKSASIRNANALRVDWPTCFGPDQPRFDYLLGNPPFIGKQYQNEAQKADMAVIMQGIDGAGVLDYVTAWYLKAARYMKDTNPACKTAFVSTNSVAQGEQVGILWNALFGQYGCKLHFAHQTFRWNNEARGMAAVHVVIEGFARFDVSEKRLFEYDHPRSEPHERRVSNLNPYLVEGPNVVVLKRRTPLCPVPEIVFGSMPNDGGFLLLSPAEKAELLAREPGAARFLKRILGSDEFINGLERWCLWLVDASPSALRQLPEVRKRVEAVRQKRLESSREATRKLADFPALFGEIRQPQSTYLAIPEVSSERRYYIPIGYLSQDTIATNKLYTFSNATPFHFGILSSTMHMAWVRYVCGRLKSDYQYSAGIVYNNFPWPEAPTDKQREAVENAAGKVLEARQSFFVAGSTLADLYDPLSMPPALVKAHQALDKSVDACYGAGTFATEAARIRFLFGLYERYTAGLFGKTGKGKAKGRRVSS